LENERYQRPLTTTINNRLQLWDLDIGEINSIYTKYPKKLRTCLFRVAELPSQNTCQHHSYRFASEAVVQEHREWFNVILRESVGVESTQVWRHFVDEIYPSESAITEKWARMIAFLPKLGYFDIFRLERDLGASVRNYIVSHYRL
jgi:hypothetical protein